MNLVASQAAFMAQILDEDAPLPASWGTAQSAGMAVYRNNYRSSLVEAVRNTYERTARWVGEDAFRRAAVHHLILHPPAGWSLDEAGRGFDQTCAKLFTDAKEVAELAWLEWAMFEILTLADHEAIDQNTFSDATAQFSEEDWSELQLSFIPGIAQCQVDFDLMALWNTLSADGFERINAKLEYPRICTVWREGERPVFVLSRSDEAEALDAMIAGASYGEACAILMHNAKTNEQIHGEAMRAGAMLGRWINDGLITQINPPSA